MDDVAETRQAGEIEIVEQIVPLGGRGRRADIGPALRNGPAALLARGWIGVGKLGFENDEDLWAAGIDDPVLTAVAPVSGREVEAVEQPDRLQPVRTGGIEQVRRRERGIPAARGDRHRKAAHRVGELVAVEAQHHRPDEILAMLSIVRGSRGLQDLADRPFEAEAVGEVRVEVADDDRTLADRGRLLLLRARAKGPRERDGNA